MDVENANCKLKVSQCLDMEICPVPRPIKIDKVITGLERLLEELHAVFSSDYVNVQDVQKLMAGYKSEAKHWRRYAKFDRFRYTRNLVDAGNGAFNVMIICWGPGHASAIHDHADSHCFMKVLSGSLDEVRYDWPQKAKRRLRLCANCEHIPYGAPQACCCHLTQDDDIDRCQDDSENVYSSESMNEISRTRLEVNDVCYINDTLGLHRVENPSHVDGAVTLHLYCPPFDSCKVFDARTGKPTEVKVTFWSEYGKKINRIIHDNIAADSQ